MSNQTILSLLEQGAEARELELAGGQSLDLDLEQMLCTQTLYCACSSCSELGQPAQALCCT